MGGDASLERGTPVRLPGAAGAEPGGHAGVVVDMRPLGAPPGHVLVELVDGGHDVVDASALTPFWAAEQRVRLEDGRTGTVDAPLEGRLTVHLDGGGRVVERPGALRPERPGDAAGPLTRLRERRTRLLEQEQWRAERGAPGPVLVDRLCALLADRLGGALPPPLVAHADRDQILLGARGRRGEGIAADPLVGSIMEVWRHFLPNDGDPQRLASAARDLVSSAAGEAAEASGDRYEGAAELEGDRLRLWFGVLPGGASRADIPQVLPELAPIPVADVVR